MHYISSEDLYDLIGNLIDENRDMKTKLKKVEDLNTGINCGIRGIIADEGEESVISYIIKGINKSLEEILNENKDKMYCSVFDDILDKAASWAKESKDTEDLSDLFNEESSKNDRKKKSSKPRK